MKFDNFSPEFKEILLNRRVLGEMGKKVPIFYSIAVDKFMKDEDYLDSEKCIRNLIAIWDEAGFINKETGEKDHTFLYEETLKWYRKVQDEVGPMIYYSAGVERDKKLSHNDLIRKIKSMKKHAITGVYMLGRADLIVIYSALYDIESIVTDKMLEREQDARFDGKKTYFRSNQTYVMGSIYNYCVKKFGETLEEVNRAIHKERSKARKDQRTHEALIKKFRLDR